MMYDQGSLKVIERSKSSKQLQHLLKVKELSTAIIDWEVGSTYHT